MSDDQTLFLVICLMLMTAIFGTVKCGSDEARRRLLTECIKVHTPKECAELSK